MTTHTHGFHHFHIRKRIHQKHEPYPHPNKLKRVFDKIIYVVAILVPIMNIPQLFKIWFYKNASGISLISWISFSVFSLIWVIYGIIHKEKPIIFMNFGLMIMQILIAIGAILYG